jgi:hypothetical protein
MSKSDYLFYVLHESEFFFLHIKYCFVSQLIFNGKYCHIIFQSKSGQEIFYKKKSQTPMSLAGFSFRLAGSADVNNHFVSSYDELLVKYISKTTITKN